MRSVVRTALALLLAIVGIQASAEAQQKPKAALQDRNRLSTDEIRAHTPGTVYQLIRARRPHWLSVRGQTTLQTRSAMNSVGEATTEGLAPEIVVYVDNAKFGSQDALRSIHSDEVDSIEYLNSNAATQRFGTGHAYGAIVIRRRVAN